METSVLIKNATIVNYNNTQVADVALENGKIKQIGKIESTNFDKIIDAKDKFLIPGGIDPHVHLNLPTNVGPSVDDFNTGTKAAIAGGTTTVIDFVTPSKGQSLVDAFLERKKEAEIAHTNVKLHVSPIEWTDTTEQEMTELVKNHDVCSFKIYMAYKKTVGLNDQAIVNVMKTAKKLNAIVTAHCENDEVLTYLKEKFVSEGKTSPKYHALSRPAEAEVNAIQRMLLYSHIIGTTIYIVHVSTKKGIQLIGKAQQRGLNVYAETCPHYLILDDSVYDNEFNISGKYVISPPIRKKEDSEALWEHIQNGTVYTVGTDHCPFNIKGQKDVGINDFTKIPNGAGGIEHRLLLMYTYGVKTGLISMQKFVEINSTNPAKIFRIPNKGIIKEGYDADLVIFDPNFKSTISVKTQYQTCDNNIYEGYKVNGKIEHVFINGKTVFEQ